MRKTRQIKILDYVLLRLEVKASGAGFVKVALLDRPLRRTGRALDRQHRFPLERDEEKYVAAFRPQHVFKNIGIDRVHDLDR